MFRIAATIIALTLASPSVARDIILNLPADCTLGETCFIQNYVDRDPGPGAADFTCSTLSYDNHTGTDIALHDLAAMEAGVAVLAAAPGRVSATRDDMPDQQFTEDRAADIEGRECGNGVVIQHGGEWETQYCHMRMGSISVEPGQRVGKGTPLGMIGLSGRTEFPHVHLSVRHQDQTIDPFDKAGIIACGTPPEETYWQTPVAYEAGGILNIGFSDQLPEFDSIKAGTADMPLRPDSPGFVMWGHAFGLLPDDRVALDVTGPDGPFFANEFTIERPRARAFRATGKRHTGTDWPSGTYHGVVTLIRNGQEIDRAEATIVLSE